MVRRAFTLIELLVVVSIIALLIAILLPVLSSARQSSRRMQCASNLKSITTSQIALAVDNDGRFLLVNRGFKDKSDLYKASYDQTKLGAGAQDHIHFMPRLLVDELIRIGIDTRSFICPERAEFTTDPTGTLFRTAYYTMSGRNDGVIQGNAGTGDLRWVSPRTLEDPADLVMAADIVESGTNATSVGLTSGTVVSGSHGSNGLVYSTNVTNSAADYDTLLELGFQGSNIARLDSSVTFESANDLELFRPSISAAIRGWWLDTESNNNP